MLQKNQEELDDVKCRVLVLACGPRSGALQYLEESKCSFPLLLDPERKMYHLFGLRRSVAKVWNTETLVYYGEQKSSNRHLHAPVEGDDPHQMGGDFIISNKHKMALVYCSQAAPDRPSYQVLIDTLKDILPSGTD